MQDRIHRELIEIYHTSVDRKYYQMISQVSFSHTFLFIFSPKILKSFYLFFFFINKFYFLGCKFLLEI